MSDSSSKNLPPDRPPGDYVVVGGLVDETNVTIGLFGDDLEPDEITRTLKCDPSCSFRRGDPISDRGGERSRGAWLLSMRGKSPQSPADLTAVLLERVNQDRTVWAKLSKRFDIQLRYGLFQNAWNRGFDLPASIIEQITRIRAHLVFDIYADFEDNDAT